MTNHSYGDLRFEPDPGWAKVPHGVWLREATAVAVDGNDNVYVFNRGNFPVAVFDVEGNFLRTWGEERPWGPVRISKDSYGSSVQSWYTSFKRPHAAFFDTVGNLWLVDDVGNQIHKTTTGGDFLMTIGNGEATERESGRMFCRPTDVAVHEATGNVFISDGYGNSRVHRLKSNGRHVLSWGRSGSTPGAFSLPHNLTVLGDEVAVCDRENHRIQVFSIEGEFMRQWHVHKPTAIYTSVDKLLYVGEQGPPPIQRGVPNLGNRVSIYTTQGELVARFGSPIFGEGADQFLWPHSVAVDSNGDVYVAEVSFVEWGRLQSPVVDNPASIRKWKRIR